MSLLELFCHVDDFWQAFRPSWHQVLLTRGHAKRIRQANLSESEIMTIMILFHQSGYRNFKWFYLGYVRRHLKAEFPHLVTYSRFVQLQKRVGVPCLSICIHTVWVSVREFRSWIAPL